MGLSLISVEVKHNPWDIIRVEVSHNPWDIFDIYIYIYLVIHGIWPWRSNCKPPFLVKQLRDEIHGTHVLKLHVAEDRCQLQRPDTCVFLIYFILYIK